MIIFLWDFVCKFLIWIFFCGFWWLLFGSNLMLYFVLLWSVVFCLFVIMVFVMILFFNCVLFWSFWVMFFSVVCRDIVLRNCEFCLFVGIWLFFFIYKIFCIGFNKMFCIYVGIVFLLGFLWWRFSMNIVIMIEIEVKDIIIVRYIFVKSKIVILK